MPISDPHNRFFYPHHTPMKYTYYLISQEFKGRQCLCKTKLKKGNLNFGCATFCALPSFGAVMTFSSHTTFSSHKVSMKGSDIDMCSAIYFLFDHNKISYNLFMSTHCSCHCLVITSMVITSPAAVKVKVGHTQKMVNNGKRI